MGNQNLLRLLLTAAFTAYLLQKIYVATEKLWQGQIGSTEVWKDSDEAKFPSITFCPRYMYNSDDSKNFFELEDMLVSITQKININKYVCCGLN